jgi:NTP pyrophosphatase (non-canonical NTP hydrolase)
MSHPPAANHPHAPATTQTQSTSSPAGSEPVHIAGGLTVSGFQALIRERYFATDSARGVPATFMWFIEEVGELSTALANNAPGKSPTPEERANLDEEFADVVAWLCTLANISGVNLEQALQKYTIKGKVEGTK